MTFSSKVSLLPLFSSLVWLSLNPLQLTVSVVLSTVVWLSLLSAVRKSYSEFPMLLMNKTFQCCCDEDPRRSAASETSLSTSAITFCPFSYYMFMYLWLLIRICKSLCIKPGSHDRLTVKLHKRAQLGGWFLDKVA